MKGFSPTASTRRTTAPSASKIRCEATPGATALTCSMTGSSPPNKDATGRKRASTFRAMRFARVPRMKLSRTITRNRLPESNISRSSTQRTCTQSQSRHLSSTATGSTSSVLPTSSPLDQTLRHAWKTRANSSGEAHLPTAFPTVKLATSTGHLKCEHRRAISLRKNSRASTCRAPRASASSVRTLTPQQSSTSWLTPFVGPNASLPLATTLSKLGCKASGTSAPSASRTAGMCRGRSSTGNTS